MSLTVHRSQPPLFFALRFRQWGALEFFLESPRLHLSAGFQKASSGGVLFIWHIHITSSLTLHSPLNQTRLFLIASSARIDSFDDIVAKLKSIAKVFHAVSSFSGGIQSIKFS